MSQLNGDQTRHVNTFNQLEVFFTENKDIYSKNPPFQKWVERLLANNKKIPPLSTTKGISSEGATESKDGLKAIVADSGGIICSYATDYAVETNNSELYTLVNYTANHILHLRDAEVLGLINGVVSAVTPVLSDLASQGYPVTAEDLAKLSEQASVFNTVLGKNELIISNSSIASHEIDAIIKDNRTIIIRLDRLVNNFKKAAPGFVEGYRNAKLIRETGVRHSGIVAKIENKGGVMVEGATVTLSRDKTVKTATISEEGSYEIIKCTAGIWKLTIVAPGYETQTATIKILRGVIQKLNIVMQSNVIALPEIQTA